jgi:hypothetical protein
MVVRGCGLDLGWVAFSGHDIMGWRINFLYESN